MSRRGSSWIAIPFFLCVGLLLAFYPVFFSGFRLILGDPGDTRFVNYLLEHSLRVFESAVSGTRTAGGFWNPAFYYPVQNVMGYSETLISAAPLYWIWRWMSLAPDTSFQLWLMSALVLNYFAAYRLLRDCFGLRPWPSSAGAFLFAFGSSRIAQINHPQLALQWYMVGALYAAIQVFSNPSSNSSERSRTRFWIVVFFGCFVAQLYSAVYHGWFIALASGVALVWAVIWPHSRQLWVSVAKNEWKWIVSSGVACVLFLLPLIFHYSAAAQAVGLRTYGDAKPMIPRLGSWVFMGGGSWLYSWMSSKWPWDSLPAVHEHALGIGLVTSVLSWNALLRNRRLPVIRFLVAIAVTLFVCMTYFLPTVCLWGILFPVVPGATAIRAVSRVGLMILIPASVGFALAIEKTRRKGLVMALGLFAILEQGQTVGTFDKYQMRNDVAQIQREVMRRRCDFFYSSPVLRETPTGSMAGPHYWKYQIDAMWAQLETGVPTLNGYSGSAPPGYPDRLGDSAILLSNSSDEVQIDSALRVWMMSNHLSSEKICWIRGSAAFY